MTKPDEAAIDKSQLASSTSRYDQLPRLRAADAGVRLRTRSYQVGSHRQYVHPNVRRAFPVQPDAERRRNGTKLGSSLNLWSAMAYIYPSESSRITTSTSIGPTRTVCWIADVPDLRPCSAHGRYAGRGDREHSGRNRRMARKRARSRLSYSRAALSPRHLCRARRRLSVSGARPASPSPARRGTGRARSE